MFADLWPITKAMIVGIMIMIPLFFYLIVKYYPK